jgi:hypothetical protein
MVRPYGPLTAGISHTRLRKAVTPALPERIRVAADGSAATLGTSIRPRHPQRSASDVRAKSDRRTQSSARHQHLLSTPAAPDSDRRHAPRRSEPRPRSLVAAAAPLAAAHHHTPPFCHSGKHTPPFCHSGAARTLQACTGAASLCPSHTARTRTHPPVSRHSRPPRLPRHSLFPSLQLPPLIENHGQVDSETRRQGKVPRGGRSGGAVGPIEPEGPDEPCGPDGPSRGPGGPGGPGGRPGGRSSPSR